MSKHPGTFEAEREISGKEIIHPAIPVQGMAPTTPTAKWKPGLRHTLMVGGVIAALSVGGYYAQDYWTVGRFLVSTDDAYVQADTVTIAPKISGYLSEVAAQDNQSVRTGTVLARIDDRDYRVALDQSKADVEAAGAAIASRDAALDTQAATVESARATLGIDEANQTFAEQENRRYADLATTGFGTVQNAQNAAARIAAARAIVQRDTAALASATAAIPQLKAERTQAEAALTRAQAVEHQAALNLSYTQIVAPTDGVVGNRTLRVGQYVQAGTQLMSVVPTQAAYVVANFKETQLTDVGRGLPVTIAVDMFPGRVFHGHVDSLAPASGQSFALLPPDNATGNFTKVVQRIPVKITIDPTAGVPDLRPGMSVEPSVNIRRDAKVPTTLSE